MLGEIHGYVHFGASAITYESPFGASEIDDVGDNNDGDDYSNTPLYFSKECHESKQTIVHPLFLNKGKLSRVESSQIKSIYVMLLQFVSDDYI